MSLRLQYDPLKVRDARQSLAWDPVHVDVVILQVQSQQGRRLNEADFTHRLRWNSTGTHLCIELHTHKSRTNILIYIVLFKKHFSSFKKDLSSKFYIDPF